MHHEISPSVLVVLKINFMSAHLGLSKNGASPNAVVHHHGLRKLRDLQHGGFFGLPHVFGGQTHPQLVGGSHPDFGYTQIGVKIKPHPNKLVSIYICGYIYKYVYVYIYIYVYINFQMDIVRTHIYIYIMSLQYSNIARENQPFI